MEKTVDFGRAGIAALGAEEGAEVVLLFKEDE